MSKGNIAGIHNFCDRWCERCFFTTRCSVYASENVAPGIEKDIKNKAFWERLSKNFEKAKFMLEDAAKKSGVDLKELELNMQETEKKEEELRARSLHHPISKLSLEYTDLAKNWLKTQPGMMDKLELLKEELTLGVESQKNAKDQIETIKDSLAVIEWYSTFIHIKFMRALMGKEDDDQSDPDTYPRDSDGSAKIAIIGVERSMQAWLKVFELLPSQEDHFLKALSMLERIKNLALRDFPEAMKFIRPGFDEG